MCVLKKCVRIHDLLARRAPTGGRVKAPKNARQKYDGKEGGFLERRKTKFETLFGTHTSIHTFKDREAYSVKCKWVGESCARRRCGHERRGTGG